MKALPDTIADSIEHLGQGFVLAYYLPAMIFVLIHSYLLFPFWPEPWRVPLDTPAAEVTIVTPSEYPESSELSWSWPDINLDSIVSNTLSNLVTPFLVGIVLVGLNSSLIRMFEGKVWWLQNGLLARRLKRNRQRSRELYAALWDLRKDYEKARGEFRRAEGEEKQFAEFALDSIEEEIRKEHQRIEGRDRETLRTLCEDYEGVRKKPHRAKSEKEQEPLNKRLESLEEAIWKVQQRIADEEQSEAQDEPSQEEKCQVAREVAHEVMHQKRRKARQMLLPRAEHRVTPTVFGNVYALAEEYPYECYGADAVLFWARLRALMYQAAPEHSARITNQKTSLDMAINFSVLFGVLSLEAGALLIVNLNVVLLVLGLSGLLLCVAFHQSSINALRLMGELIKNSFDYHRGLILDSFGLETPDDLVAERQVWNDLAAFIRRGEPFYFPAKYKKTANETEET